MLRHAAGDEKNRAAPPHDAVGEPESEKPRAEAADPPALAPAVEVRNARIGCFGT